MTLSRLIETGSGTIAARLEIEGLSIQPVSDPAMAKTLSDGRRRVYCLNLEDAQIAIEEQVNIPEAELDGGAGSGGVTLFETEDEDLAQVFSFRPDLERYVIGNGTDDFVAVADTQIDLLSTAGITAGDVVHIGTEAIKVGTVASSTRLTGCTRAYWNTIAQKHWTNVGDRLSVIMMHNRPLRVRGRRARLFLYGDGDDLTGDGTQKWIGFVSREPGCDEAGGLWRIGFEPLTVMFESKLGGALEVPSSPRGIYYPWNEPLVVRFRERISATSTENFYLGLFVGFWETQREFIDALNTWLSTAGTAQTEFGKGPDSSKTASLPTCTLRAEEDGLGWTIRIGKASGVDLINIHVGSAMDGLTLDLDNQLLNTAREPVTAILGTSHYYPRWRDEPAGARGVPRGWYGQSQAEMRGRSGELAAGEAATYPQKRMYLDRAVSTDWTSALVEWPERDADSNAITAVDVDPADNFVVLESTGFGGVVSTLGDRYTPLLLPSLQPIRRLAAGSLSDLRDALVTEGPLFANRATAPFVTSSDLADWSSVAVEAERGKAWLQHRTWDLGVPATLTDVLKAEFQLRGVYPVTDSTGKIALALFDVPNAATVDATTIDEEIISVGWSNLKRGEQTVNRYVLKLGYNPIEDEWDRTIDPYDATSYSTDHIDRPMTVEPRSRAAGVEALISPDDVAEVSLPYFAVFGYPYDLVEVNVSWKLFDLLLGSSVSFSADHLPDFTTGQRPISEVLGIVVGRRWEIGQAHGRLTLLLPWSNVTGYAPTARITSQTNTGGNTWELGLNLTKYAPTGTTTDQFFEAGDEIRIVEYDSESPTTITGTVDSVDLSGHVTTVTLDSAWTPASTTWELMFRGYGDVQASQKRFCFTARSDGTLGGSDNARVFAA